MTTDTVVALVYYYLENYALNKAKTCVEITI